jgi:hypothetical protein
VDADYCGLMTIMSDPPLEMRPFTAVIILMTDASYPSKPDHRPARRGARRASGPSHAKPPHLRPLFSRKGLGFLKPSVGYLGGRTNPLRQPAFALLDDLNLDLGGDRHPQVAD